MKKLTLESDEQKRWKRYGSSGGKKSWDSSRLSDEQRAIRLAKMVYGNQKKSNWVAAKDRLVKLFGAKKAQELIIEWDTLN